MEIAIMKSFEEIQAARKEGFEALTASTAALTKGYQAVATEVADFSMKSFEKSAGHWKKIVSANSFDKAFEVHQAFAKETFDATVAEFSKLGELYASAAKSAFKRYEASVDAVDVKPTEASVGSVHIKLYEASVNAVNVKPTDASLAAVDVKPYEVSVDAVDVKPTEASLAAVDVKPYEASVGSVGVKARVKK